MISTGNAEIAVYCNSQLICKKCYLINVTRPFCVVSTPPSSWYVQV